MQSWGTESRFEVRDTQREPTKSGIVGLLCAALGRPREEDQRSPPPHLRDLVRLRMGVRVDREGQVAMDYHTAGGVSRRWDTYGVRKASGAAGDPVVSRRYYLADAAFVVGLEGDPALLRQLAEAVRSPVWQLYLGRKAFVPSQPVLLIADGVAPQGVADLPLEEALRRVAWPDPDPGPLRAVLDVPFGQHTDVRQDVPLDFAARQFGVRYVATRSLTRGED
jgi:CRISPR system Cascade subunit CasD